MWQTLCCQDSSGKAAICSIVVASQNAANTGAQAAPVCPECGYAESNTRAARCPEEITLFDAKSAPQKLLTRKV
jgi:hypothetical protein